MAYKKLEVYKYEWLTAMDYSPS